MMGGYGGGYRCVLCRSEAKRRHDAAERFWFLRIASGIGIAVFGGLIAWAGAASVGAVFIIVGVVLLLFTLFIR